MKISIVILAGLALVMEFVEATVYFQEKFDDGNEWQKRWVESMYKGDAQGKFILSAGKFYGHTKADLGIQTSQDSRFYTLSARFRPFTNEEKTLVVQFTVKHEQKIDCGGGYIKLFPKDVDQKVLHGGWPYYIMFGKYYDFNSKPLILLRKWSSFRSRYLWAHEKGSCNIQL